MSAHFDDRETRSHQDREAEIFTAFPAFLDEISATIPGWRSRLSDTNTAQITSRDALATIPVLRKAGTGRSANRKPTVWRLRQRGSYGWQSNFHVTRAGLGTSGARPRPLACSPGDTCCRHSSRETLVHNGLSYHMTPGGFILDEGIRALGARVYPGGAGNTEAQVDAAAILKPVAFTGTPDFLKIMLDKADEAGKDLSSFNKAIVSGGALFPSLREEYASRGVNVMQAYATADLGVIAYESMADGKLCDGMVCNEDLLVEIVRPGTDDPVPAGEVGELVVTSFNRAYPLVRFGTGDLSAVLDEPSPCGRTNLRIKGWMGRADQRTKVKGMFVDPKQVDELVKSTEGVERARLIVTRDGEKDVMTLHIEGNADVSIVGEKLASLTNLKGSVEVVQSLPNDGKVIDDQRDYSS